MYERFLLLLKKNNMSVAEFSRKTGIKQSTLSNWKTRNTLISTKYARLIANFFGVSVEYLMGDVDDLPSNVGYYYDQETADLIAELRSRNDIVMLLNAARNATPNDVQMACDILKSINDAKNGTR